MSNLTIDFTSVQRHTYKNVQFSIADNSKNIGTTCTSINRGLVKSIMVMHTLEYNCSKK